MGGPCSRLDKMRAALLLHLPSSPDSATATTDLILRLVRQVRTIWGLALGVQDGASNDASPQAAAQGEVLVRHADAANTVNVEAATAVIVAAGQM